MASAFVVHTARDMVCLAQAGKLRLAQDASSRKLFKTAGSAFVGPMAVKSWPRFRASLHSDDMLQSGILTGCMHPQSTQCGSSSGNPA